MDALGHVKGIEPCHAKPSNRSGKRRANAVDEQPGLEQDGPGYGTSCRRRKNPGITSNVRGGHDGMLRQVAELVDARMLGEVARGCDDHALHVAADSNGHHGGVWQLGDAEGDVDSFLDQIGVAIEQDEIDRYSWEGFEIA